jgi:hypothetical protein
MFNFDSIFYWKEHNRGVIQTTNIQLQYIINIPFKSSSPSDQRTCKYCKHLVEDEIHFLFRCPQYSSIRSKFGIYEKVLVPTDILDEEMIKTINQKLAF